MPHHLPGLLCVLVVLAGRNPRVGEVPSRLDRPEAATGDLLHRLGYQPVRLRLTKRNRSPFVDTTLAGKPLRLLVDTGARDLCLDAKLAVEKFGLRPWGKGQTIAAIGDRPVETSYTYAEPIRLGAVECPARLWVLTDLTAARALAATDEEFSYEGLLGSEMLSYFSAVIDLGSATLWLLDPVKREEQLQGGWQAVAISHRSGSLSADVVSGFRLALSGNSLSYTGNGERYDYKIALNLRDVPKSMDWRGRDGVRLQTIYRLDGDNLTVAIPVFEGDTAHLRPQNFDHVTNRVAVIKYVRVGAGDTGRGNR